MTMNPLARLGELGQSPWYDFIKRDLLKSGELKRLIDEDGLKGMTSNPTIFENAIRDSSLYDDEIQKRATDGAPAAEIFEGIAVGDVREACDIFRPVYDAAEGHDGLVSLEVAPALARDTAGTIEEVERLWHAVDRPNLMIKIPGTVEGLPAIEESLARGYNINITLLFAVARYEQVIEAFWSGLERRLAAGSLIGGIASVASFFVSRMDTNVDGQLDKSGDAESLRGKTAIANAAIAYRVFERSVESERWQKLASNGAKPQRLLWASTSTKDPRYPDVYYVEALIAPHTVNTLPPATFDAYRDHGQPEVRIHEAIAEADAQLTELESVGIDLRQVTDELENDGVAKFAASHDALLAGVDAKARALVTTGGGD